MHYDTPGILYDEPGIAYDEMAASNAILVANAVVAELNAQNANWTRQFEAVRGWLPVYRLEELQNLNVTVVPDRRSSELFTRKQRRYTYEVVIDFQQAASGLSLTDMDALVQLVDGDVTGWFQDWHYLTGLTQAQAGNMQWSVNDVQLVDEEVYWADRLYDEGIFEAALVLQIKGNQP